MKKLLFIFLLFSFSGFAQAEKDSLFAKDIGDIYNTLKVMHYLEREVMEFYIMEESERKSIDSIFQYYLRKRILTNNPVPSTDILRFLEIYLKKDIPTDWQTFSKKVNNANAKLLLAITDKYGYPTNEKIEKFAGIYDFPNGNWVFSIRPNRYHVEMAKMMKKEHSKGNVKDQELQLFTMLANRVAISGKELEQMNKSAKKSLIIHKPY